MGYPKVCSFLKKAHKAVALQIKPMADNIVSIESKIKAPKELPKKFQLTTSWRFLLVNI